MWAEDQNSYVPVESNIMKNTLPVGVYTIKVPMMGPVYLEKIKENFNLDYKIYGKSPQLFVDRVLKSFENTQGNLGILLDGIKGTGKTVTSEMMCNAFAEKHNMPVILITQRFPYEFLANIQQDVVVFIDEFEKVFSSEEDGYRKDHSGELLTIMDGALKSKHRRLFLFTTNTKDINDNLLSRPGRLRYIKEYGSLDVETIKEVVTDLLEDKTLEADVIEFIMGLSIITIDIVKSVIEEVNIHKESPSVFKSFFNVKEKNLVYTLYKGENDSSKGLKCEILPMHERVRIEPTPHQRSFRAGSHFYADGNRLGVIESVNPLNKSFVLLNQDNKGKTILSTLTWSESKGYHEVYEQYLAL